MIRSFSPQTIHGRSDTVEERVNKPTGWSVPFCTRRADGREVGRKQQQQQEQDLGRLQPKGSTRMVHSRLKPGQFKSRTPLPKCKCSQPSLLKHRPNMPQHMKKQGVGGSLSYSNTKSLFCPLQRKTPGQVKQLHTYCLRARRVFFQTLCNAAPDARRWFGSDERQ